MESLYVKLIILCVTCACGWTIIAYEGYAHPRGWPIGSWMSGNFSWLQGIGYLGILESIVISFIIADWWTPIIIIIGGNILVRIALPVFKAKAQIVATVGLVIGIIISLAYVI